MTPTLHPCTSDSLHEWDEPREESLIFSSPLARLCRPLRAERDGRATVNAALQRKQTAAAADSEPRTRTVKETTLSRLAEDTHTHTCQRLGGQRCHLLAALLTLGGSPCHLLRHAAA